MYVGVIFEKSYLGSVSSMKLNSLYAAVLFDGKIQLHAVGFNNVHVEMCEVRSYYVFQIDPESEANKDSAVSMCPVLYVSEVEMNIVASLTNTTCKMPVI